jgi:hypothetical protein
MKSNFLPLLRPDRQRVRSRAGLVLALIVATIAGTTSLVGVDAASAATIWTLSSPTVAYVSGAAKPIITVTANPAAAISASACNVYTTADTSFASPIAFPASASVILPNTLYVVHCTATAATGYAATPTSNTDGYLTVQTPFVCDSTFYQQASSKFYKMDSNFSVTALGSASNVPNGIGWNPDDNFIYGTTGSALIKVGADGSSLSVGALSAPSQTSGGDFWRYNGTSYLLTTGTTTMSFVNVTTRVVTPINTPSFTPKDLTIVGNTGYGFDTTTLYIAKITPGATDLSGTTVAVSSVNLSSLVASGDTTFGAAWSDADGNAYFYGNTTKRIVSVTKAGLASAYAGSTPAIATVSTVNTTTPSGFASGSPDGASCPLASSPTAATVTTSATP